MKLYIRFLSVITLFLVSCNADIPNTPPPASPAPLKLVDVKVNDISNGMTYYNINNKPVIRFYFTTPVRHTSADSSISFKNQKGDAVAYKISFENKDSTIVIQPSSLTPITQYAVNISTALHAQNGKTLSNTVNLKLVTAIDSSDKFPRITDSALLTLIEKQTLRYFWDFGHPVSGMARERNTSGDVCATGGTGFGIMCILAGIHRNFITREEGLKRIQKIVHFLKNKCTRYHGAFSHWINGATGETIPFSPDDDGADLVETSFLMQGLLCARQYFHENNAAEDSLRSNINDLWNGVEWTWFHPPSVPKQEGLYWHWSPDKEWIKNLQITGWNEALITYVLAASANKDSISKVIYDKGWANDGAIKNGKQFYGITLPLGPDYGGPLFFAHYSFLGLNPHGLSDAYADYWTQDTAQTKINYFYCVDNPQNYNGYSKLCWGLTASDDNNGYKAHSPTNDNGVISPTAAVSSLPYAPEQAMDAIKFFYYTLGDKIWGDYGFKDAFNLTDVWFADSYLAIDQGPQVIMIENYRSGLLWNLFMSCPEIKRGLERLGFTRSR